ncbi:hypothetical protein GCM10011613_26680 [Cellvibrio zantedeschiae]|uniref:EAL domain-containing protein n=1 Tax=Cellvibrio zantedeschiae TaxID=1237077 RepID=A0ABQ3B760_9GAMM|nr:GGDEF domain-containing phosphodiesterase [Cellvibrio zantedeschiae]GGY80315.1 hypothetical protein GCM10011613_26680 [Cellvibrio zantedeschiae]
MTNDIRASAQQLAEQDESLVHQKLVAMFRQLPNVLIFTFAATSALAFYFYDHSRELGLWTWWGAMQLVSLLRLGSLVWWRKANTRTDVNWQHVLHVFSAFALLVGVLWASFTVAYFSSASASQRMVISLVMSTVAAGSVSVLALVPWVNRVFIVLLVGPLVLLFAQAGKSDDLVVAGLGVVLFIGLTGFSRVTGENFLSSVMAVQRQHKKMASVFAQRDELIKAKDELEARVMRQIAALQAEMDLKERYAQELDKIANCDQVTGLLNRAGFDEGLKRFLSTARDHQEVVGMMAIEVLHFDVVELQGSLVSDQVLLALADRLKHFMPQRSLIASWGGAEFFVASAQEDIDASETPFWNRYAALVQDVLQQPIDTDVGPICIDVLIGVTRYPDLAINNELMLYQSAAAKHNLRKLGVGGIKVFDPHLDSFLKERHHLRQALHKAIEHSSLSLVFQPVVPSLRSQPYKMEALLRWRDDEFGQVSPTVFIPIAEESGLIVPLGRWVLHSACVTALDWPNKCVICVNVSIHQILSGSLLADIQSALEHSGLAPSRLEIEITESVFAQDIDYLSSVLRAVRDLGVRVAIDDFGTGYSSLAYLRRLPVDTVKIDRSFINELDLESQKFLFSIVTMARGLGFYIVAEGVETRQQKDLLLGLGVDYIQGYFFSKPIDLAASSKWLADQLDERVGQP